MLASTVKFSRYGRAQVFDRPLGRSPALVRVEGVACATDPSGPNSVLRFLSAGLCSTPDCSGCTDESVLIDLQSQCSTFRCLPGRRRMLRNQALDNNSVSCCLRLLRKEVIQPHLPVRLPCYDLVLITGPTFDGSLHKGWATGFGCYRLS